MKWRRRGRSRNLRGKWNLPLLRERLLLLQSTPTFRSKEQDGVLGRVPSLKANPATRFACAGSSSFPDYAHAFMCAKILCSTSHVSCNASETTLVWPTTGMKLVSAGHRGTM